MYKHLIAAAFVGSSVANAALYTETENFSFVPNGTQALVFNKRTFAPGEVLTGVSISWVLNKTGGSLGVDNESLTTASGQITQTIIIDLDSFDVELDSINGPGGIFGQNITAVTTSPTLNLGADDGDGVGFQTDGSDWAITNFGSLQVTGSGNVHSGIWSQYLGAGTFTLDANGVQFNDTSAFGGASGTFTPASASGSVTVSYTTVIPEPSSVMLLGLAGLGTLVRRRRN